MASSVRLPSDWRERYRQSRKGSLERDVRFSWPRAVGSLVSYALLLTDVIRSGVGIHRNELPRVGPNEVVTFGPFAYLVNHVLSNDTSSAYPVWPYKFDSTSISMRAYAEVLDLKTPWSPCLHYKEPCPGLTLDASQVLRMLDALIDAVAEHRDAQNRSAPALTLRVTNVFVDRVHHFVLPQFFQEFMVRTSQALYYDANTLRNPSFRFCSPAHAQPYVCSRYSTSFELLGSRKRQHINRFWHKTLEQKQALEQRYRGLELDMVVVESRTDHNKPTVSYQGQQLTDFVVLTRIRSCLNHSLSPSSSSSGRTCSTVAIDDYRVEMRTLTSTVTSWFPIIALLRVTGQTYAWLRVLSLFIGCYYARSGEPQLKDSRLAARLLIAAHTLLLVPSQVVVYGSAFPIACYVFAHALDSEVVYDFVATTFDSTLGTFSLDVGQFLQISAVSMRSIWELALALHLVVSCMTSGHWSHADGVPGIAEFVLTFVAGVTIMGHFRAISLRDAHVESISEMPTSTRVAAIRDSTFGTAIPLGNSLDFKCLAAGAAILTLLVLLFWSVLRLLERANVIKPAKLSLWSRTFAPYSTGTLWPTTALVVNWNDVVVFNSHAGRQRSASVMHRPERVAPPTRASTIGRRAKQLHLSRAFLKYSVSSSRRVQQNMHSPAERSREVESLIYLMNLAAMTDPIVLLRLWWCGSGHQIGVYESKTTERVFLIPLRALEQSEKSPVDWSNYRLLFVVNTKHLTWPELLHCG